jgi:4-amino-4-deoxy-L-arabinose transferase-like glycosyltransferase
VQTAAARSVSAVAGLLTLLAVFAWANRTWGLRAAIMSALVLLTTIEFAVLGRYGDLNMLLTLWVTVGMLGLHRWATREGRGPGLFVATGACALGALTKGLVAPVLVATAGLLHLWLVGRLRLLHRPRVAVAAALFAVVAVPWYVAAGVSSPGYLRELFVQQQFHRIVGGGPGLHPEPSWFTLAAAILAFLPWTLFLPAVLQRAGSERRDAATTFCLVWAVVVVVAFTLPSGKLATYVLPAMPALALLVGRYASRLGRIEPDGPEARLLRWGTGSLACLGLAAPPIAVAVTGSLAGATWLPVARLSVVLVPFGALLGWIAARRRWTWAVPTVVAAVLSACAVFYAEGAPLVSDVVSDAQMARAIEAADPGRQATVVAFRTYGGSLPFYLDRPVHFVVSTGRVRHLMKRRGLVFIVTHHRHLRAFRRIPDLVVWRRARHVLVASRPPPAVERRT